VQNVNRKKLSLSSFNKVKSNLLIDYKIGKSYNFLMQLEFTVNKKTINKRRYSVKKEIKSEILLRDCVSFLKNTKEKFNLIIADPPYNIGKNFGNNKDNMSLEKYIEWSKEWINLSLDKLTENGIIYVYGFPEILSHIAVNFPIQKQKWLVWHYTNKTCPTSKFWQRSHESILCLWNGKRPDLEIDQIRVPYGEAYKKQIGKRRKNTQGRFGNKETIYNGHKNGALPRDVIKVSALAGGKGNVERSPIKHPTQKPFELTKNLISSKINGQHNRIYIPFCGSGLECMVAKAMGVNFVSTEINEAYIKGAQEWLKDLDFLKKIKEEYTLS